MDDLIGKMGTYMLGLGLPGVVIIGLVVALYRLFDLYRETQEKRIGEGSRNLIALNEMRNSIDSLKNSLDILSRFPH